MGASAALLTLTACITLAFVDFVPKETQFKPAV